MPSTNITNFAFEGNSIRVVARDREPWFVLSDLCRVLEISNTGNAAARLDEDEKSTIRLMDGTQAGGNPNVSVINESGLYRIVMRSDKPQAKIFQKWVTAEVLPAIRKTGGYMLATPEETPEMLYLRAMQVLKATIDRQAAAIADKEAEVAELAPKAQALDRLAASEGSFVPTDAAKSLRVTRNYLTDLVLELRLAYRRKDSLKLHAMRTSENTGLVEEVPSTYVRRDGVEIATTQFKITANGMTYLTKIIEERNAPSPKANSTPAARKRRSELSKAS